MGCDKAVKAVNARTFSFLASGVMSATAQQDKSPSTIEVFTLRCEAKAYLVEVGYLALHDAVDELQAAAVRDGLVDLIGQDGVQEILAYAFGAQR
jgi:hypothetical protein